MKSYIYIIECEDGSFYTGITKNLQKRMKEHFKKTANGAKYTKSHTIKEIKMVWECDHYSDAAKLEYQIKRLGRKKKEELIKNPELITEQFVKILQEVSYNPRRDFCGEIEAFINSGELHEREEENQH